MFTQIYPLLSPATDLVQQRQAKQHQLKRTCPKSHQMEDTPAVQWPFPDHKDYNCLKGIFDAKFILRAEANSDQSGILAVVGYINFPRENPAGVYFVDSLEELHAALLAEGLAKDFCNSILPVVRHNIGLLGLEEDVILAEPIVVWLMFAHTRALRKLDEIRATQTAATQDYSEDIQNQPYGHGPKPTFEQPFKEIKGADGAGTTISGFGAAGEERGTGQASCRKIWRGRGSGRGGRGYGSGRGGRGGKILGHGRGGKSFSSYNRTFWNLAALDGQEGLPTAEDTLELLRGATKINRINSINLCNTKELETVHINKRLTLYHGTSERLYESFRHQQEWTLPHRPRSGGLAAETALYFLTSHRYALFWADIERRNDADDWDVSDQSLKGVIIKVTVMVQYATHVKEPFAEEAARYNWSNGQLDTPLEDCNYWSGYSETGIIYGAFRPRHKAEVEGLEKVGTIGGRQACAITSNASEQSSVHCPIRQFAFVEKGMGL